MKGCAEPPVESYCDLVQVRCTKSESANAVLSDHQFDKDDCETVGILADVCELIVLINVCILLESDDSIYNG